jgi:hypothetical protein
MGPTRLPPFAFFPASRETTRNSYFQGAKAANRSSNKGGTQQSQLTSRLFCSSTRPETNLIHRCSQSFTNFASWHSFIQKHIGWVLSDKNYPDEMGKGQAPSHPGASLILRP